MSVNRQARSSPHPDAASDMTFTPIQAAPYTHYLETLDCLRVKYSSLDEQLCPPSRSVSPIPPSRADILKTKIKEALKYANYNPVSSRWSKVTGVVRMASTSRRYCGAADGLRLGENIEVDNGHYKFVLPDTEEEWKQCEQRWEKRFDRPLTPQGRKSKYWPDAGVDEETKPPSKAELVRDKVKAWQASVVSADPASSEAVSETDAATSLKGKEKEIPSKRQSPLPFPVAKRHAAAAATTGKGADHTSAAETPPEDGYSPRHSSGIIAGDKPLPPTGIADLSEMVSRDLLRYILTTTILTAS